MSRQRFGIFLGLWLLVAGVVVVRAVAEAKSSNQDVRAQEVTLERIQVLSRALLSWFTDSAGAAAAGQSRANAGEIPLSGPEEFREFLVPRYIEEVPSMDGWGHPLEMRLNPDLSAGGNVFLIRSPGRDGEYSGDSYESYAFPPKDFDHDIVWSDGFFICWPAGAFSARQKDAAR